MIISNSLIYISDLAVKLVGSVANTMGFKFDPQRVLKLFASTGHYHLSMLGISLSVDYYVAVLSKQILVGDVSLTES